MILLRSHAQSVMSLSRHTERSLERHINNKGISCLVRASGRTLKRHRYNLLEKDAAIESHLSAIENGKKMKEALQLLTPERNSCMTAGAMLNWMSNLGYFKSSDEM